VTTLSRVKRRTFLWYFLLFVGSALAMMATWGTARFMLFRSGKKKDREISADIPATLQSGVPLHVPAAGVWLVKRSSGGDMLVLDDRCPHLGCSLKWNAQRSVFECPCHGSEFDIHGTLKRGPAPRSLSRLSVHKGEDGKLRVLEKPPGASGPS
jgi:cytochrome b6-f complex iron-sulfur subunit